MSSPASAVTNETSHVQQNVPVAIAFNQLRRSKKNMRTINPKNSQEDKELLASIRAKGILQNLVAYPVDDHYEVPAGGRRFGALEYLLKHGEISAQFPVYCLLIPEEEATNASLIENYQRKAPIRLMYTARLQD